MAQGYLGKARRPAASRSGDRRSKEGTQPEQSSSERWDGMKGEGNYKAAREFDDAERKFVASGRLDEAIRNAAPKSETEKREMEDAEERARQRAKEEDPAVLRRPQGKRPGKR